MSEGKRGAGLSYSVNGLNQYTTAGPASFTYDLNGNLTGDGTNTYVYDVENRLVSATAAGVTTNLTYDPLGRLWQVVKGAANTRFLYDGDALVGEYDGTGTLTNRYVHGSNAAADDPLVWYAGATLATKRYLHADHLGSIVAATNCNASAPCLNAYDEYGVPAAANVGRFQYTGQAWLSELGLYYYKARMYSAALGRFLQTDPVGYEDQINLYAYAGNDPIDLADYAGTDCSTGSALPGGGEMAGCHNLEGFEQQEQQRTANQRGANQGLGGGGSHSNGQSQSDVSQNEKWPLVNGPNGPHYIENPNYKDPPWDPGLQGFMAFEGLGYTIAALPTLLPELPAAVEGSQGLRASSTAELRERAAAGIPKPVTVTRPMVGTPRPIGQAVKIEQVVPRTTAQKALITLSVVLKVLGLWN